MRKTATSEFPLLDVLKERWSPRAYDTKPVEDEKLWSLLEAARWSHHPVETHNRGHLSSPTKAMWPLTNWSPH